MTSEQESAPVGEALRVAALSYAMAGLPVFPCHGPVSGGSCSCGRPGCASVGKHPRTEHGFHDATTDLERVRDWWGEHPGSNIGVPTGALSGLVVLDVDVRDGGRGTLKELVGRLGGNGYAEEGFNGKPRDELLNREFFSTLWEAKTPVEGWRRPTSPALSPTVPSVSPTHTRNHHARTRTSPAALQPTATREEARATALT